MSAEGSSRRPFPLALVLVAAGTVALDQITKLLVTRSLVPGQRVVVIEGWFQIRFITNPGGLFGSFRGLPESWRIVLFSVIPLIASVALLFFLLRTAPAQRLLRSGLALILGGAVGNLIDRLRLGYVIDFLDVFWREHHYPAFNVADASICIGVGLILLDAFLVPARPPEAPVPPEKSADPAPPPASGPPR
jgi:signal peptidase II